MHAHNEVTRGVDPEHAEPASTRKRLLDAALALTREKGFDRTTLREVARRAGVTTGAIYGNFGGRDGLFMALAERQWAPPKPRLRRGASFAELMDAMAAATIAAFPARASAAVGALTFRAFVLRSPEIQGRYGAAMARGYADGAAWLQASFPPEELPMAADVLARVINVVLEGLTFQRLLTPELVTDEVVYAAFRSIAGGAAARRGEEPGSAGST